ncbi:MAG: antitoxin Xre/MbcA/ParS toxin-binding domain-containing protein [Thermoleophilaceae bacterium]
MLKPGRAHAWLLTPNPLLDHHPPIDLLREGESRQVIGAIDVLAEDVFV